MEYPLQLQDLVRMCAWTYAVGHEDTEGSCRCHCPCAHNPGAAPYPCKHYKYVNPRQELLL